MKTCKNCGHASWEKTKAGRLHPNGQGICRYKYKVPKLPNSMYWFSGSPRPCGGHIDRNKIYDDHCPYYLGVD